MKKLFLMLLLAPIVSFGQLKGLLDKAKDKVSTVTGTNSNVDIGAGLKEALNKGITEQVSKLTATDGFYKNEAVKILMPEELQKEDNCLRITGMHC